LAALVIALSATSPAYADDALKHITFEVDPTFFGNGTSDAQAPPSPGSVPIGYTQDHPIANTFRINYGAKVQLGPDLSFNYTHSSFEFALGRIFQPGVSLVSGQIDDRTDTAGFEYLGVPLVKARAYYFDHERIDVTGFCLDQTTCAGRKPDPDAIDEHGYGVGATWLFGPRSAIGPIFSIGADAKYVPRTTTAPAGVALEGLGKYPGSQIEYPYSLNMKLPTHHDPSLVWLAGYERATALFRGESTIEQYNVTSFGVVKVLSKPLSLSAVDLNFKGCTCTDTVLPPDNIRFATVLVTLSYKFSAADLH
jgi:hypothetical protein